MSIFFAEESLFFPDTEGLLNLKINSGSGI